MPARKQDRVTSLADIPSGTDPTMSVRGNGFSGSDGRTNPLEPLARFVGKTRAKYVRMANRWIRRFRIDQHGLSAEGAVHNAWVVLCQRMADGRIGPITSLEEFEKIFTCFAPPRHRRRAAPPECMQA